jgi:hypothetical protein
VAYRLRRVFVGRPRGIVRAINLSTVIISAQHVILDTSNPTCSIASLTRLDPISLFFVRFVISSSLVFPELRQAMLKALLCTPICVGLREREDPRRRLSLVRNGTVNVDTRKARGMRIL